MSCNIPPVNVPPLILLLLIWRRLCLSLKNKEKIFAFRMIQQSKCSLADPRSVYYHVMGVTLTPGGEPGEYKLRTHQTLKLVPLVDESGIVSGTSCFTMKWADFITFGLMFGERTSICIITPLSCDRAVINAVCSRINSIFRCSRTSAQCFLQPATRVCLSDATQVV